MYSSDIRFWATISWDRPLRDAEGESNFGIFTMTKKVFPKAIIVGCFAFFIGTIFEYNNSFQRGDILVESYVARKAGDAEQCKID